MLKEGQKNKPYIFDPGSYEPEDVVDSLNYNGFAVFKNTLNSEESNLLIENLDTYFAEKGESTFFGKIQPNISLIDDRFSPIITHPKIISIFKNILGKDSVYYTAHSDIHLGLRAA